MLKGGAEFSECITWDLPSYFLLCSCASGCSLHPVFYLFSDSLNSLLLRIYGPLGQLWHPEDEDPGEVVVDLKRVALQDRRLYLHLLLLRHAPKNRNWMND